MQLTWISKKDVFSIQVYRYAESHFQLKIHKSYLAAVRMSSNLPVIKYDICPVLIVSQTIVKPESRELSFE